MILFMLSVLADVVGSFKLLMGGAASWRLGGTDCELETCRCNLYECNVNGARVDF